MTTSPESDTMDPVRLQLLLTGVREAIGELPARAATGTTGPRFLQTADSPLFDALGIVRPGAVAPARPSGVVPSPQLRPGGPSVIPALDQARLVALIQRSR